MKRLHPYFVTFFSVFSAALIMILIYRIFDFQSPLYLYITAVMLSAWYGGLTQGLTAMAISLLLATNIFSLLSPSKFTVEDYLIRSVLFLFDSTVISLLCESLRNSREKAQQSLSEAQKARESAKQNFERIQSIYESNMIGLLFADTSGRFIETNDYVLKNLGYTRDDLKHNRLNWHTLTPPEYLEVSIQGAEELKKTGKMTPIEKEYFRKDGSRWPILVGSALLPGEQVATFILDIGKRKKAEKALFESYNQLEANVERRTQQLKQSEDFLDSLIENNPMMIYVKDAKDLRFLRINRAGERLLGISRKEILGKTNMQLAPTEEVERIQKSDQYVVDTGEAFDLYDELLSTTNGVRHVHTRKIPIFGKDGKVQYILGILEDTTEKRLAESRRRFLVGAQAARREAEKTAQKFAFFAEATAALNESLDLHTIVNSFANSVVRHLADWCAVDLINESTHELQRFACTQRNSESSVMKIHEEVPTDSTPQLVFRTRQPKIYNQIPFKELKDVLQFNCEVNISDETKVTSISVPLEYQESVLGTLTLLTTDYNSQADGLTLTFAQELSRRLSMAIENARLYQQSQQASHSKSLFLANMSHEIRTPLGAILGFTELARDPETHEEDRKEYLATVTRNGEELLRLVNEILDLSKVESGLIQVEAKEFDPVEILEDVITLLQVPAHRKKINLSYKVLKAVPKSFASDPTRFRQILMNMIGNALKFTDAGEVQISIDYEEPALKILISDTGIGIAKEEQSRLFQPFVQADDSTTRKFGGTGLGLALSRKLAQILGGDLKLVKSAPGEGSTFSITIASSNLISTADKQMDTHPHSVSM